MRKKYQSYRILPARTVSATHPSMVLKKQYNYSAVLGKTTPVFSRMYLIKYFKYQGQIQINTNLYGHFQQFQIQMAYLNTNTITYLTPTLVTTFSSIFGPWMITD